MLELRGVFFQNKDTSLVKLIFMSLLFFSFTFLNAYAMDPIRINAEPTITSNFTPELKFNTTYNGTCKGNLDENLNYSDMGIIFVGNKSPHSYIFSNNLSYGAYMVYVKCIDDALGEIFPGYYFGFTIIPAEGNPNLLPPTMAPPSPDSQSTSSPPPSGGGPSISSSPANNVSAPKEAGSTEKPKPQQDVEKKSAAVEKVNPAQESPAPTGLAIFGIKKISLLLVVLVMLAVGGLIGGYYLFTKGKAEFK